MLYREAGQFKTTYAADQAIFPIARTAGSSSRCSPFAFLVVPLFASQYLYTEMLIPVPDPRARGDRAQHPDRLLRPALARHRRLHGGRRLCRLQARAARCPETQSRPGVPVRRPDAPPVGILFGLPSCASRASISRSRRWRRSSSSIGCSHASNGSPITRRPGSIAVGRDRAVRVPIDTPSAKLSVRASRSWSCWRSPPRTWCAAASGAPGWRSATWTSPPRSSASGRCTPSSRPSRSARSISASPARCGHSCGSGSWEPLAFDINRSFQILFMIIIGGLGIDPRARSSAPPSSCCCRSSSTSCRPCSACRCRPQPSRTSSS